MTEPLYLLGDSPHCKSRMPVDAACPGSWCKDLCKEHWGLCRTGCAVFHNLRTKKELCTVGFRNYFKKGVTGFSYFHTRTEIWSVEILLKLMAHKESILPSHSSCSYVARWVINSVVDWLCIAQVRTLGNWWSPRSTGCSPGVHTMLCRSSGERKQTGSLCCIYNTFSPKKRKW